MFLENPFIYRREALAEEYCRAMSGRNPLKDARSGLFLAAPRRTGKSTFLRQDLVPTAEAQGWLPIYVDLWTDRNRNPAELIAEVIVKALDQHAPLPKKVLRAIGLQKFGYAGAVIDIGDGQSSGGLTVAAALEQLWNKVMKPIVLVVDEAQHALTTEEGQQMLYALKAARDQLNQEAGKGLRLMLVMTGSSRDKLSFMIARKSQAFYGCDISHFPLLDDGFVEAYAQDFNRQFNTSHQFPLDAMKQAFELVGRRPEMFKDVVGDAVKTCHGPEALAEMVSSGAQALRQRAWQDFAITYAGLSDNQKAVLDAIARLTPKYEPYASDAMAAYQAVLGKAPSASTVQSALKALQDKELIWLAARAAYAFDDELLRQYYLSQYPLPPQLSKENATSVPQPPSAPQQ